MILTDKAQKRLERNKQIIKEFKRLYTKGSHKTAVCDVIAIDLGMKRHGVYKVVNAHLKSTINEAL